MYKNIIQKRRSYARSLGSYFHKFNVSCCTVLWTPHTYCKEKIVNLNKEEDGTFFITSDDETSAKAKKVVLAVGYHDVYPDIPGLSNVVRIRLLLAFVMVTNRDSVWGIVVNSNVELERLPKMPQK